MRIIEDRTFPGERALYGERDVRLLRCAFEGEEDGESALKEARNVELEDCRMALRYPLWHDRGVTLTRCVMTDTCRAPLWYSERIVIADSTLGGVKALRECEDVRIRDTEIVSPEFGWHSRAVRAERCRIEGEYPFLMASGVAFDAVTLKGKYSFQYARDAVIERSVFDTKDAFWHAKNVTIRDTVIRGEYLAWYSENLTLIRCRIAGTQPLCYCRGLTLVDCEMEDADLAFEYSDVEADVRGRIVSVKNPLRGHIRADSIGEILLTEDSVYPCECAVTVRENETEREE